MTETAADEFDAILAHAIVLAEKYKITKQEALLLLFAHEVACIHFHIDRAAQVKSSNTDTPP